MLITAVLSLLIASAAFIGNRHLLRLIFGSVEAEVMDNAATYFWFTAMSYPFLALYNSGAALFRSMGNSKVSMKVSLAMNAINVAGNALCVFGLRMGVEGVAIPTLLSRMFAAVVMVLLVRSPKNSIRVNRLSPADPSAGYDQKDPLCGNSERPGKWHVPVWKDCAAESGFHAGYGIYRGLCGSNKSGDVPVSAGCGAWDWA